MSSTPVVVMSGLARDYQLGTQRLPALRGLDLVIDRGEYVSIVGPSGCGKSTLLNCLGCLDRPSRGRYFLDGTNVADLNDDELSHLRNQRIGFVFQAYNLLSDLDAVDNVGLPLFYRSLGSGARRRIASEALRRVGLESHGHHHPDQLSGGQRQRVALARALVGQPSLILADEPTGALDSKSAKDVFDLFEELNRAGTTLVLVTHDLELAGRARRRVRMRDGSIVDDEILRPAVSGIAALDRGDRAYEGALHP